MDLRGEMATLADWSVAGPEHTRLATMSLLVHDAELARAPARCCRRAWRRSRARWRTICEPLLSRDLYFPSREGAAVARRRALRARRNAARRSIRSSRTSIAARVCGEVYRGELHDRFWIYWYQLWLAERAVHAAAAGCARRRRSVLRASPSRFSRATSIDTRRIRTSTTCSVRRVCSSARTSSRSGCCRSVSRRICSTPRSHGARRSRARLDHRAELARSSPSTTKARRIDRSGTTPRCSRPRECSATNRQRSTPCLVRRASCRTSRTACSRDGTWYEGENYHLFAHRGLVVRRHDGGSRRVSSYRANSSIASSSGSPRRS